jgi:hypothetical protein
MAGVKLSVTGQAELKALSARLKDAGEKGLRKELRRAIKTATGPALRDVQEAARTIPVRGARGGGKAARRQHYTAKRKAKGGHGLRATIARATRADIKASGQARVTIRTYARYLPADQRKLPRYLDREKGWRHPVFAQRDWVSTKKGKGSRGERGSDHGAGETWVAQYGQPWFAVTLIKHGPKVRKEILIAMKTTADKITNG